MALKVILGAFLVVLAIFGVLFIVARSNVIPETFDSTDASFVQVQQQFSQQGLSNPFQRIILPDGVIKIKCEPTAQIGSQGCPPNNICGYLTNPDGSKMIDEEEVFITGCQSQLESPVKTGTCSATFTYYVDSLGKKNGIVKYISHPSEGGTIEGSLSIEQASDYIKYMAVDLGCSVTTNTQTAEMDPTTQAIREVPSSNLGFLFGLFILAVLSLGIYIVYRKVGMEDED